jgi:UrcA family protein
MHKLISTALVGASLLAASPAFAQNDTVSMSVSTADLNLANASDRARLDRRIRSAASQICDNGLEGVQMKMAYQSCRADILSSAGTPDRRAQRRRTHPTRPRPLIPWGAATRKGRGPEEQVRALFYSS